MAIDGLQEASDGTLVLAIARYHEQALAEAYRRHAGAVFALARRLLAEQSLAEEVLLAVGGYGRNELCPGSDLDLLLVHDGGRSTHGLPEALWYPVWDTGLHLDYSVRTPREVLDLAIGDHVKEVLERLPADERRAIELAYFGGLTYREVAARLDQPEGTVKSRIRSGLKRMRADLVDAGIGGVWSES